MGISRLGQCLSDWIVSSYDTSTQLRIHLPNSFFFFYSRLFLPLCSPSRLPLPRPWEALLRGLPVHSFSKLLRGTIYQVVNRGPTYGIHKTKKNLHVSLLLRTIYLGPIYLLYMVPQSRCWMGQIAPRTCKSLIKKYEHPPPTVACHHGIFLGNPVFHGSGRNSSVYVGGTVCFLSFEAVVIPDRLNFLKLSNHLLLILLWSNKFTTAVHIVCLVCRFIDSA